MSTMPSMEDPSRPVVRRRIQVGGLVQGVGFRPYVYRLAALHGIVGLVWNSPEGVIIEAQGLDERVESFLWALPREAPPVAIVLVGGVEAVEVKEESSFRILPSSSGSSEPALVSPELATCDDCLRELMEPGDRRFRYPFINCTNCGPRFTVVETVPYDRIRTTMRHFPLCPDCSKEYADPLNRRFHAEPVACPACGPRLLLLDPAGVALPGDPLAEARRMLSEGRVLAVKGLGGFHLSCDARDEDAIARLRLRKGRPDRPLAVMARDLGVVRSLCDLSEAEARELSGHRRPILLLRARRGRDLAPGVAPGHATLGVMLPYTPLHHLLLEEGAPSVLVMTSGNFSGGPITATSVEAVEVLGAGGSSRHGPIVDAILDHDRDIANRADDSVGYLEGDRLVLIRRSRGFTPLPVTLPQPVQPILALGALLSTTFCVATGRRAFLSQHIGDTDSAENVDFLARSVEGLLRWLEVVPQLVVHDLHPDLPGTRLARELADRWGARCMGVQHHHAHLASAALAAGEDGPIQALVLDGTGFGLDGTTWGAEHLVGDAGGFKRRGNLLPFPLPGGDAAVHRPLRIAAAWLHALNPESSALPLEMWKRAEAGELEVLRRMVDRRFHCPLVSSAGRLFDAVAALLGVRDSITYEGQAAIELEQLAWGGSPSMALSLPVMEQTGRRVLDPGPLLEGLVQGILGGAPRADLAASFHRALAWAFADLAIAEADIGAPRIVALTGGAFVNRLLVRHASSRLQEAGLRVLLPASIPVGDGGLALGQVAIASTNQEMNQDVSRSTG